MSVLPFLVSCLLWIVLWLIYEYLSFYSFVLSQCVFVTQSQLLLNYLVPYSRSIVCSSETMKSILSYQFSFKSQFKKKKIPTQKTVVFFPKCCIMALFIYLFIFYP